jgi:hypothetical protein
MTKAQRDSISSPPQSLLIFQTDGTKGFYFYDGSWKAVTPSISGLANRKLSNLTAPTAINQDLLPGTTNAKDLGSSTLNWKDFYLNGNIFKGANRILNIDSFHVNVFLGTNTGIKVNAFGNTAVGHSALQYDSSGRINTAMGFQALQNNSKGNFNTAVGGNALLSNSSGFENSAFGVSALLDNTTGNENCAFGNIALQSNSTGIHNTAVGVEALAFDSTESENTAVGFLAGFFNNSTNSTFLGSQANPGTTVDNAMALGAFAQVNASNKVVIGNTSITSIQGNVGFTTFSDGRFKKNIKENVPGLAFINQLRPITYNMDVDGIDKANEKAVSQSTAINSSESPGKKREPSPEEIAGKLAKAKIVYTGFVAQEVEQAAKKLNYDFSGVDKPQNNNDFYGLRYSDFVVPLVKAVQELSKENEELKKELQELKELIVNKGSISNSYSDLSSASLEQNAPNPFNSVTIIRYHLPETSGNARVVITDMSGKTIKIISLTSKGTGQLTLSSGTLAAGSYNYTLWIDGKQVDSKQMIITK